MDANRAYQQGCKHRDVRVRAHGRTKWAVVWENDRVLFDSASIYDCFAWIITLKRLENRAT